MGLEAAIALLPRAGTLFGDVVGAVQAFNAARAALSETDKVKADAAYASSFAKRQMDELRVELELLAASQR